MQSKSHLTRVRGLKYCPHLLTSSPSSVAPYAGAWIEIDGIDDTKGIIDVAPYAGAWIEISVAVFRFS